VIRLKNGFLLFRPIDIIRVHLLCPTPTPTADDNDVYIFLFAREGASGVNRKMTTYGISKSNAKGVMVS